jgi:hypothetical protein
MVVVDRGGVPVEQEFSVVHTQSRISTWRTAILQHPVIFKIYELRHPSPTSTISSFSD